MTVLHNAPDPIITHLSDGRVCTPQTDGTGYAYWEAGTRLYCDRSHEIILTKGPMTMPEDTPRSIMREPDPPRLPSEPRKDRTTWDTISLHDVLDGEAPNLTGHYPHTPRGVVTERLSYQINEQKRARDLADTHRRYAEQCEEYVERLESEVRELEDAVRMLTAETPTQPDHG